MNILTPTEANRYSRHVLLPEVGVEGQRKLKAASVLVVGAGGLGCPVLQYLAAAGVGNLGIIDFDTVDESNLQRQILYGTADIGAYKSIKAEEKLKQQNPLINYIVYNEPLSSHNAVSILSAYDIIVDGTDNFSTRYLISDACIITGKPLVFGSIFKFEGQVTVFNYQGSGSYRCLFPEMPAPEDAPNCSEIGVIGVLPGIVGTLQANEVVKIILGIGEVLAGKLLVFDALGMTFHQFQYHKNLQNFEIETVQEFIFQCRQDEVFPDNEITGAELLRMLEDPEEKFLLIDVREPEEFQARNIRGLNIPLKLIEQNLDNIPKSPKVIFHCQSGIRSKKAIDILRRYGYRNLWNLKGGLNSFPK